jgi:hypothetical protein
MLHIDENNKMLILNYDDIAYHALSKEDGYVMLQLSIKDINSKKKEEEFLDVEVDERIFLYPEDKKAGKNKLFYLN